MVEMSHKKAIHRFYDALPFLVVVIACLFLTNGDRAWNTVADLVSTDTVRASIPRVDIVSESPLVDWFEAKGAKVHFDIKIDEQTGQRGAFAAFDMAPKSTVFSAPLSACIPLEGATPSYQAFNLLVKMQKDPYFTRDYLQYWASLPLPNETFSAELFTDDHIKALHTPELEKLVMQARTQAIGVYLGFGKESGGITCAVTKIDSDDGATGVKYCSLAAALGEKGPISEIIPIETFMHMTSLISSRHFAVEPSKPAAIYDQDPTKNVQQQYYLVPVGDLLNYSHDNANVDVINDGKHLMMITNRPVNEGEQLYFDYLPGLGHRNDINLISYGFLHSSTPLQTKHVDDVDGNQLQSNEHNTQHAPLMAAVDVPTFQKKDPYAESPENDEIFYGEEGYFKDDPDELERLQQLLDEMPTSVEEDEAELLELSETERTDFMYWKNRVIVEYRLQRRRAIEYNAQRIRDTIDKLGHSIDDAVF